MTDERLDELERLSNAVLEARRQRDAVPTYIEVDGRTYINTGPEVWGPDGHLADADKEYGSAIRQSGHELIAEVRRLRAELAARDDRWQRAVGCSLETAAENAAALDQPDKLAG
jgi:hypothetical protein